VPPRLRLQAGDRSSASAHGLHADTSFTVVPARCAVCAQHKGQTSDSLSKELLTTRFYPRRWAFSIWGLIFFLEGLGIIYQLLPYGYSADSMKARIVNAIGDDPCAVCSAACCVIGIPYGST